ncbi:hypothetical protein PFICI_10971 [Pestalotiopsis fici W106-1]|uniref:Protein kinase domain-containing protein n=1 Tax=Pestalotiopsis fici (strain W106-1 / CGMCC3.15140) TaxID=1229662 RepID=W3WVC7_PESFW|nr:uncharacterized protein PFICI_10971 [Pestalotiopsis fici W106-1]ETS77097.1 hypothetical protein PFICI_10971 [Pestalotiopsis fici W106-1]
MAGLPKVPGPRLLPFDFNEDRDDLEFIEFLGKGIHAHVWKVRINQREYALKIFPFWKHDEEPILRGLKVSERESLGYFDPFSCECRAYARLKENGIEEYAVKCHGYILLRKKLQEQLKEKDHHDWKEVWGWKRKWARMPLRSLVKDFVEADFKAIERAMCTDSISYDDYQDMLISLSMKDCATGTRLVRAMKSLHRSGILVRDLHNENVAHGKFLDFSSAWTSPHPCFTPDMLYANRNNGLAWSDLSVADGWAIDHLVDEWNERLGQTAGRIPIRMIRNYNYLMKVRSQDRFNRHTYGVRCPAEMHNWSAEDKRRWKQLCQQS